MPLDHRGGGEGKEDWSARYDLGGQLIERVVGADTIILIYNASGKLIVEIDNSTGQPTATYSYDLAGLLSTGKGVGVEYPLYDGVGSVVATSNVKGQAVSFQKFDEFGEQSSRKVDNFQFTSRQGSYTDSRTDMVLNWNRWYQPNKGTWFSRDPIGTRGGINLYRYADNSPVLKIDPDGLQAWRCQRPLGGLPGKKGPIVFNHVYICVQGSDGKMVCKGLSTQKGYLRSSPRLTLPSEDYFDKNSCEPIDDDLDQCFENCVKEKWKSALPTYGIGPQATDCQEFSANIINSCGKNCK